MMLLYVVLLTAAVLLSNCIEALNEHRVFPAASFERYAAEDETILRVVDPNDFDIIFPNFENNKDLLSFLQAAKERYLKSFFLLPDFPDSYNKRYNKTTVPLKLLVLTVSFNSTELQHGVDESYSLIIDNATSQEALLNATTVYGVLHGLETFSQLLQFEYLLTKKNAIYSLPNSFWIADAPEYPYRGLLIDTARHYLPISLILANLDAMAMNKLNVLHWHVTDSQSFPYRSIQYPELADKGAYHPKRVYTPKDVQLIVKQAMLRGIRVIPEFDLPGHSQAIGLSHPQLLSQCPQASEPLDPTQSAVYDFIDGLYAEITHFFFDSMIHIGGDEVSLQCWKNSTTIQQWMKQRHVSNETELYALFETKLQSLLGNVHKKQTIVWQEVYNLGMPLRNDTIIDVWKSTDNTTVPQATAQGYEVVSSQCWYLDALSKTWRDYYQCLPRNFTGTAAQKSRVLGGHASMWGEMVDVTNFVPRVWPRASAVAERLWTGSLKRAEANVEERLSKFRCYMVARGIAAEPIAPGSCPREADYEHLHSGTNKEWATTVE